MEVVAGEPYHPVPVSHWVLLLTDHLPHTRSVHATLQTSHLHSSPGCHAIIIINSILELNKRRLRKALGHIPSKWLIQNQATSPNS